MGCVSLTGFGGRVVCITFIILLFSCNPTNKEDGKSELFKHRVVLLTDILNEADDSQTMVRLLMYSNELDIEGVSEPDRNTLFDYITDEIRTLAKLPMNYTNAALFWTGFCPCNVLILRHFSISCRASRSVSACLTRRCTNSFRGKRRGSANWPNS